VRVREILDFRFFYYLTHIHEYDKGLQQSRYYNNVRCSFVTYVPERCRLIL